MTHNSAADFPEQEPVSSENSPEVSSENSADPAVFSEKSPEAPVASENPPGAPPVPSQSSAETPAAFSNRSPDTPTVTSQNSSETPTVSPDNPPEAPAISSDNPAGSLKAFEVKPTAKLPVSPAKVQANRENSRKSTGPTSQAGKDRVRRNSLKHGLLAKALFSRPIDGEDPAEFHFFLDELRRDLKPVGMREEMHVEGAAVCYWLIQRSLGCEGGEIKRSQLLRTAPGGEDHLGALVSAEATAIDDHLSIPTGSALKRILRYRTSANKELSHHLAEFERLQRIRKGEHIPPPINVQLS